MVSPALGREGVRGRVAGKVKSALCRDACECVCIVQKQLALLFGYNPNAMNEEKEPSVLSVKFRVR